MRPLVCLAAVCLSAAAQSPTFEAASVKPAAPATSGPRGIWSPDPARVTGRSATLAEAIRYAYNVRPFQMSGPSWLEDLRFDIDAKAPAAATAEEFRQMMQALLAERFHLAVHREAKEMAVYEMTVAKGGLKTTDDPKGNYTTVTNGTADQFARALSNKRPNDPPIVDKTGIQDTHRFALSLDPEQDLGAALEDQLGLKLSLHKAPTEVIVVDHADKAPTGN